MSWRVVKLGDLVENFSVRAKDYGGSEGLDFCGVSNEEGIIKTKYAAEDKAEDYKIIEKGCFAYNPYRVNVGSIGLVKEDFKGLISPAYVVFKPKPNSIIPELLFKFLKSDEGLRQIRFYGRGTVRQALRFEDLCNIELSIPEYPEQKILFDRLINSQEKSNILATELTHQLILVKKLRQQLLQDAVQGKLSKTMISDDLNDDSDLKQKHGEVWNMNGKQLLEHIKAEKEKSVKSGKSKKSVVQTIAPEEIPFEIPEGWVWCRLGEICKVKVGSTPSRDNPIFWNGDIPWVSSGAVANNFIFDTKEKITKLGFDSTSLIIYPKGSVLVAMIGQGKTRGQTSILKIDATTNQNVAGLIIEHAYLLSEFLWYFFLSRYEITRGGASGGNQPALNGIKISNTVFPFPPLSEQHHIVQKLDELMQTCDALEASIKESSEQNEKLLQQVLREALRHQPVEDNEFSTGEGVLAVAAEPIEEYGNVKNLRAKPTYVDFYKRTLLAAEIVWQMHQEPTLGHLKLQKLIYLCQEVGKMQLPTNFTKQVAGPYDGKMARSLDKQLKEKLWFEYHEGQLYKFKPLEKAGSHKHDFEKYFANNSESINEIILTFKSATSNQIELVATLYACWDEILSNKEVFSEALLIQRFYEWSDAKVKFKTDQVENAIAWMIQKGILPNG